MKVFELFGEIKLPGLDKVNSQLKGLQGKVQKLAPSLRKIGVGMAVAGGAIVGGFAISLKAAADFETSMREVNTMMGLSQQEFTDFSKEVQALASDLGVDAVESAQALYQAISAGVPKENVLDFLAIATKAAIGGATDTKTAVDGLTTVMNAFKLPMSDAQKVADIMFTTIKGGKTTFEELSASIFQVAPIAAASGVKFEEVAAALATMTKQGVPTSVATTQLRQAMVSLQKPTKEMNAVIKELGYESGQAMVDELGLAETLNVLRNSTGGSNEMLMKMFGSVEAGAAVLSLTGDNAEMFATDLEAMANSSGAATDAFNEMEKSASRQMEALKSALKNIQISIGDILLPILKSLVEKIKPVIEIVKKWVTENPGLTKTIVLIVGAIGGLLLVLGPILIMLPGIIALLPILGAAFALLMGPIGLIILGIIALIAIGVAVWKNWDTIKVKAIEIWNGIVSFFKSMPQKIGAAFSTIKDIMLAPFRAVWKAIGDGIDWVIDKLNSINFTLPSWIPGLGGKSFGINIPKITLPEFKYGGVIPGPIGQPIPIVAHGGERISEVGRGTAPVINIYPQSLLGTKEDLVRYIREALLETQSSNVGLGFKE